MGAEIRGPAAAYTTAVVSAYVAFGSGWKLQLSALALPSQMAHGPVCGRCGRVRGYLVTLYSRTDYPLSPIALSLCWHHPLGQFITKGMATHTPKWVWRFFLLVIFPVPAARRAARLPPDVSFPPPTWGGGGGSLGPGQAAGSRQRVTPPPAMGSPQCTLSLRCVGYQLLQHRAIERMIDKPLPHILHHPPDVACLQEIWVDVLHECMAGLSYRAVVLAPFRRGGVVILFHLAQCGEGGYPYLGFQHALCVCVCVCVLRVSRAVTYWSLRTRP